MKNDLNAPISVFELNQRVKKVIESDPVLPDVRVRGEISNFVRASQSGHLYFSLKDDRATLKCVMFRGQTATLKFNPSDGQTILCRGRVTVFEKSGQYQLYVSEMEPEGLGALFKAFMELRERLDKEGLFDPAVKRPLPVYPSKIGVVTSLTGAAARDFVNVAKRRDPGICIVFAEALVQGFAAPPTIVEAIRALDRVPEVEVIVVTRGGGSFEDLNAFNDEAVARAVRGASKPVVAAIGHETDFSIAEFAADLRAPTPSAAAEIVVRDTAELAGRIRDRRQRLELAMATIMRNLGRRLLGANVQRMGARFGLRVGQGGEAVDLMVHRARMAMVAKFRREEARSITIGRRVLACNPAILASFLGQRHARSHRVILVACARIFDRFAIRLDSADRLLSSLSPSALLSRGYAWVEKPLFNSPVRSISEVVRGEIVNVRVSDGALLCHVEDKVPGSRRGGNRAWSTK